MGSQPRAGHLHSRNRLAVRVDRIAGRLGLPHPRRLRFELIGQFVNGAPQAPQVLGQNLSFPDGVTVVDSAQIGVNFLRLPVAVEPGPSTCNGSG